METRGCCAVWDEGRQHLTDACRQPGAAPLAHRTSPHGCGLTKSQVTVICPDIGGGFGQKIALYREELTVAALARALKRPVRWREDRGENLLAAGHAREQTVADPRRGRRRRPHHRARSCSMTEDFGAYCFYPANYLAARRRR